MSELSLALRLRSRGSRGSRARSRRDVGDCVYGDRCKFAHGEHELRPPYPGQTDKFDVPSNGYTDQTRYRDSDIFAADRGVGVCRLRREIYRTERSGRKAIAS